MLIFLAIYYGLGLIVCLVIYKNEKAFKDFIDKVNKNKAIIIIHNYIKKIPEKDIIYTIVYSGVFVGSYFLDAFATLSLSLPERARYMESAVRDATAFLFSGAIIKIIIAFLIYRIGRRNFGLKIIKVLCFVTAAVIIVYVFYYYCYQFSERFPDRKNFKLEMGYLSDHNPSSQNLTPPPQPSPEPR